jgi:hypothetical protein
MIERTKVSENAIAFQETATKQEKKDILRCANWFIDLAGIFGHYAFFTKELWRKVKGFKHADKGEIIAVFLHWWFRYEYGFQTQPVGCGWSCDHPTLYDSEDELYDSYINKYMPVIEAFYDWCYRQR